MSEPEIFWDDADPVPLRRVRTAVVVVAPAHHTLDLEGSTANCPDDEGEPRIGWQRVFDAVTGFVLFDVATPVPGCIVC